MISVPVFERDASTGEQKRVLGDFDFVQLPSPGDDFNIRQDNGREGCYRVLRIAHEPLRTGQIAPPPEPGCVPRSSAFVYVTFIREYGKARP